VSIGGGSAAVVDIGALSCCCPGGAVPCCLCAVCGAVAQLEAEAQQQAKGGNDMVTGMSMSRPMPL
jgi:hypothetical protein